MSDLCLFVVQVEEGLAWYGINIDVYHIWAAGSQQQLHKAVHSEAAGPLVSVCDAADSANLPIKHYSEQADSSAHGSATEVGQADCTSLQLPGEHLLAAPDGANAADTADASAAELLQQADMEVFSHLISHSQQDAAVVAGVSAAEMLQQSDTGVSTHLLSQVQEDPPDASAANAGHDHASAVAEPVAVSSIEQLAGASAAVAEAPVHTNKDTASSMQNVPLGNSVAAQHADFLIGSEQALTAPQDFFTEGSPPEKPTSSHNSHSSAAAAMTAVISSFETPLMPEDLQLATADVAANPASDATGVPGGHHHLSAEAETAEPQPPQLLATPSKHPVVCHIDDTDDQSAFMTGASEDASGVVHEADSGAVRSMINAKDLPSSAEGMPSHAAVDGESPVQPVDLPKDNESSLPTEPDAQFPPNEHQVSLSCCKLLQWQGLLAFHNSQAGRLKCVLRLLHVW